MREDRQLRPEDKALKPRMATMLLAAAVPALVLALVWFYPPVAVGDGAEYVAMMLAWGETHRPYVTEAIRATYEALGAGPASLHIAPSFDHILKGFALFRLGDTWDMYHFWLYSMLAAGIRTVIKGAVAPPLSAAYAFGILHAAFAGVLAFVAARLYGVRGVLVALLVVAGTPALWFANKIHTEFFTICISCTAVLLCMRARFLPAALCFAALSTQNGSFGIVTLVALGAWLLDFERITLADAVCIAAIPLLLVVHPAYYFFRHGFLDPQIAGAGTETDAAALDKWHLVLIDPDIGLLPNWPLGLLLAVAAVGRARGMLDEGSRRAFLVLAAMLVVDLFAQSLTTNVNHGGTIDVSRYATWYLCFFVPPILALARPPVRPPLHTTWGTIALVAMGAALAFNVWKFWPTRVEHNNVPTALSRFIQTHIPWAYKPYGEIFAERYGLGEGEGARQAIVVGPDCRRIAVAPSLLPAAEADPALVVDRSCPVLIDPGALLRKVEQRLDLPKRGGFWRVVDAPPSLVNESRLVLTEPRTFDRRSGLAQLLWSGWSIMEDWGVWTDAKAAALRVPALDPRAFPGGAEVVLRISAFAPKPRSISVGLRGQSPARLDFRRTGETREVVLKLPREQIERAEQSWIDVDVDEPTSPKEAGVSLDERKLGMSLMSVAVR